MKTLMTTTALALALASGPALAQSTDTEQSTEGQNGQTIILTDSEDGTSEVTGESGEQMATEGDATNSATTETDMATDGGAGDSESTTTTTGGDSEMAQEGSASGDATTTTTGGDSEMAQEGSDGSTTTTGGDPDVAVGSTESDGTTTTTTEGQSDMAQTDGTTQQGEQPMQGDMSAYAGMTVGDLLGRVVESPEADRVGEVDYVIEDGSSLAAVIGVGGFLGLGEHTVALPLQELRVTENGTLVTDRTKDELEAMTELDETGLESLPDDMPLGETQG